MTFKNYDPKATIRWYDEHSARYDDESFQQTEERYGGDLYRIELIRQLLASHGPKRVLDVGCGTGVPMLRLLEDGYDIRGFDFSPGMIAVAKQKLVEKGHAPDRAEVGDLLDPGVVARFGESAYDAVVVNGVLPYIPDRDLPHRHLAAFVRPGGLYLSAYSNALFDLVTFNRFTVRFHAENFLDPLGLPEAERAVLLARLRGLIAHPDEPKSIPVGARDSVFVRGDNPLAIGGDLARHGLRQIDIVFYKFHAFPPLLRTATPGLAKNFFALSRAYEIERARDWRGYFLASTFIVVCRKEG